MRSIQKIMVVLILVLLLIIGIFLKQAFSGSGSSATFQASCFVPDFASMSDEEERVTTEDKQESTINEANTKLIRQEETIISEDNSKAELIITVSAR